MLAKRIIPRLDIKGPNLVKGVHLEGLRVIGDPAEHALRYYQDGADELLFMDIVASLYQRNNLTEIVERVAEDIFVPLTVGGGVRSCEDIHKLLRAGADKVAINTAAIKRPEFITEAARVFGSQCIVVSIEVGHHNNNGWPTWEAMTDNGREHTGFDASEWAREAVARGAGELLITSVDDEGTRRGMDVYFLGKLDVSVPVIVSGGAGSALHVQQAFAAGADAVAVASILHYKSETVRSLKNKLRDRGVEVRCA